MEEGSGRGLSNFTVGCMVNTYELCTSFRNKSAMGDFRSCHPIGSYVHTDQMLPYRQLSGHCEVCLWLGGMMCVCEC